MTKETLSLEIGLPVQYLIRLSQRSDRCYQSFYKKKKSGTKRRIDAPNKELKGVQSWILRNILSKAHLSESAHGFIQCKGIRTNATEHCDQKYLLCMDIADFFPTINKNQVYQVFNELIKDEEPSEILTGLTCYKNRLPQGAVTSPMLSNIVFLPVDEELTQLSQERRIIYTRYADDLSFSGNVRSRILEMMKECEQILNKNKYKVKHSKTRIMSGKGAKIITGLRINQSIPSIGRIRKKQLRAAIHNLIIKKNDIADSHWIIGMLSFLKDIEPKTYKSFIKYIDDLKTKSGITTV